MTTDTDSRMFSGEHDIGGRENFCFRQQILLRLSVDLVRDRVFYIARPGSEAKQSDAHLQIFTHAKRLIKSTCIGQQLDCHGSIAENALGLVPRHVRLLEMFKMKCANLQLETLRGKAGRTLIAQEDCSESHKPAGSPMGGNVCRDQFPIAQHIVVEEQNQFAFSRAVSSVASSSRAAVWLFDHPQPAGSLQSMERLGRSIARAIYNNNDLEPVERIALGEQGQDGTQQLLSPIEGWNNN
ncbi:MAG TPA: hypothetical protein VN612_06005 [Acidobacteriaceae bacterium]|nr:hypothetical protein [Acidobacteriaceae bacterium]